MGINSLLARWCNQTAVYWGSPVNNGTGGFTYDTPVEIKIRWESKREIFKSSNGEESVSLAVVYPLQDLDENGMLYLGVLDDLSVDEENDPMLVTSAYSIKRFDKSPDLKAQEFVRKAYL